MGISTPLFSFTVGAKGILDQVFVINSLEDSKKDSALQ